MKAHKCIKFQPSKAHGALSRAPWSCHWNVAVGDKERGNSRSGMRKWNSWIRVVIGCGWCVQSFLTTKPATLYRGCKTFGNARKEERLALVWWAWRRAQIEFVSILYEPWEYKNNCASWCQYAKGVTIHCTQIALGTGSTIVEESMLGMAESMLWQPFFGCLSLDLASHSFFLFP